jgi:hypothetical protein
LNVSVWFAGAGTGGPFGSDRPFDEPQQQFHQECIDIDLSGKSRTLAVSTGCARYAETPHQMA